MKKKELEDLLLKGNLNLLPATFLDERESQILKRTASLMRYWPDEDLYPSLLLAVLRLPRQFKKIRTVAHIGRLISAEFFYKKKVIKAVDHFPQQRHLFVKLLQTRLEFPFGSKSVLGMVITFNLMKHREVFEEQHIIEAVNRIVPGVSVVRGSLVDAQDKPNQVHAVYLEIEREDQPEFSLDELKKLQNELPDEFKGCIEQLVPMTFMRRNEEEVYRNIVALRDQLKTPKDLPQVTITFEEQTQFDLFFTVIILRIVKDGDDSVQEKIENYFSDIIMIPDRIDYVGTMRKIYQKEATVFRLQISKNPFFRKDRSVNLYKARTHIVGLLMKSLGPFRDYNGGLILKQNEKLEDFLALMSKGYDEFFLENFFYSITPIPMQSLLPAQVVREWFLAFSELMNRDISSKQLYLISCQQFDDASIVIVRAEDRSFKGPLLKEIKKLGIPSLELGFSEVNRHGTYCFGFLYRPSLVKKEVDFCQIVRTSLDRWSEKVAEKQVLSISLHGKEPNLDPRISQGDQSYIILKMLFEGLTRIGSDGKAELALAKSYEVTPDFKTYTFHLRESTWSNGSSVTAHDFVSTWKNALDPKTNSSIAYTLFVIKNGRKVREGALPVDEVGVHAVGDHTLVVDLEHPAPYFLESVAHWTYTLVNGAVDKKNPGWALQAGETYVCNGPFKLKEWRHNRAIKVVKNPHYWDAESVQLERIAINMMQSAEGDVGMLQKREVDLLGRPMTAYPAGNIEQMGDEIEQVRYDLQGVFSVCFNTAKFPFNHRKLRQAFFYALDLDRFQEVAAHEYGGKSTSILSKALSLHDTSLFSGQDLPRARALFREGLGEIGFVKSDFPKLTLNYASGLKREGIFQELARQWHEAFKIPIYLEANEWNLHFKRLREGEYQMGGLELNARWNDPLHLLGFFEHRVDPQNIASWEHPAFQKLLEQVHKVASFEERNAILKEAEAFLMEHVPVIPLYELEGRYFKREGVEGVCFLDCNQVDFKWAFRV